MALPLIHVSLLVVASRTVAGRHFKATFLALIQECEKLIGAHSDRAACMRYNRRVPAMIHTVFAGPRAVRRTASFRGLFKQFLIGHF